MINEFLSTLQLLIKTPSVVGYEKPFIRLLQRECESLGLKTQEYQGLLEVYTDESISDNDIILSSHIDRHGLVCTGPNEFEYAAFTAKYGANLDGSSVSEQLLKTISSRFVNKKVIAYEPWTGAYIGQSKITDSFISERQNNLTFQIDPIEGISPGIPIAYDDTLTIEENWISGQLDNVFSIAFILMLYKQGYEGRTLFTCEEEAGESWRYIQAYFKRKNVVTNRLLVLDTSPFEDRDDLKDIDVVLRNKDITSTFNSSFGEDLESHCQRLGLHTVKKDRYISNPSNIGRTELGRLIVGSQGRLTGTTFQFPTINYHTVNEMYELSSFKKSLSALLSFI